MSHFDPRRLTGRCRNGAERDGGTIWHALPPTNAVFGRALCGVRPGRLSAGWSEQAGTRVTCPECLRRMEAMTHQERKAVES